MTDASLALGFSDWNDLTPSHLTLLPNLTAVREIDCV